MQIFSLPPKATRNEIDRAGKAAAYKVATPEDIGLAEMWRACHAYPINTFQATLRSYIKKLKIKNAIVAQRLKRMPTILDKLHRYTRMSLTTMQDIGGLRAVVNSVSEVYKIRSQYINSSKFHHELVKENDYIANPKEDPKSGYRGVHLIYRYNNPRRPAYNGLQVELQIRTRLQHMWATAVETMTTVLNEGLKSYQGNTDWLEFFDLISSVFADEEGIARISKHKNFSKEELCLRITGFNKKLKALDYMAGISTASEMMPNQTYRRHHFHVMELDTVGKTVHVYAYGREQFEAAKQKLAALEKKSYENSGIQAVLVSVGRLQELRRAYPNFFLDIREFVVKVEQIMRKVER